MSKTRCRSHMGQIPMCKSVCMSEHLHTLISTQALLLHFIRLDKPQFDLILYPDRSTEGAWRRGEQQQKYTTRCHSHYLGFTAAWATLVTVRMPRLKSLKGTRQWYINTVMIIMSINTVCVSETGNIERNIQRDMSNTNVHNEIRAVRIYLADLRT